MVLDLWDLTAPVNCVASCSVDGVVDGAVIEDEGDPHSTGIFVSTRSYTVYWLRLGPSGFGESQAASPWLTSSVMFCGLSEVVDARGPLFALLHLEGQGPGAFIKNNQNGAVVELVRSLDPIVGPLQPNDGSQTSRLSIAHNGIIDIQILDNTIVVARYCNFDLYSLSQVTKKLLDGGESAGISAIKACRRIDYPDLKLPVYQGGLLRQPNPYLGVESGACVLFSAELPSCYAIISRSSEAASVVTPPEVRCLRDFVQVTEPLFHFALGASGRRLAVLSDKYLTVYFTSRPDLDNAARRQDSGDLMACWMIPKSLGDIPVALDFDEATGRCVAAMASGRIWVKETANFLSETPISSRATKIPDFDLPEIPSPDPTRWPVAMPPPAPFGIQPLLDPPKEVAPRWSAEVDKYFPYKNRSDCYGSTPWLVHEALHIPVVWPGHQPAPVGEYGARTVLFTVDEVKDAPFYDEVIEVRPLPGSDEGNRFWVLNMASGDWEFYRLRPIGSLDDIVAHLQHRGIGALQECDDPWPADEAKLDQLSRWMQRYKREFRKPVGAR
ncbi:hypothetical protein M407DRAFT_244156 [Tulasnella calospora MUT 4182]|uniref:Uncharacterized protein n=1 Tax=Tulasnella calospora MUT 4182 TaxID=1051891 RepID=A0A0C3KUR4_9AGAM|nr:hypothetical protein M407DRAFT_244156 [Tulasnella calospora MUT 4182]